MQCIQSASRPDPAGVDLRIVRVYRKLRCTDGYGGIFLDYYRLWAVFVHKFYIFSCQPTSSQKNYRVDHRLRDDCW